MKKISFAMVALLFGIRALFAESAYPGYTLLQWVEANRNQYVDTGIKPQSGLTITADMRLLANDQPRMAIFGGSNNDSASSTTVGVSNPIGISTRLSSDNKKDVDDWSFIRLHGRTYSSNNTTARGTISWAKHRHIGQRATWKLDKGIFSFNGYKPDFDAYTDKKLSATNNIYVCAMGGPKGASSSFSPAAMILYSFQIKNSSTVLVNLIPAIRDSDGAIGLLDTVKVKFHENLGPKPFIAGPRVISTYPTLERVYSGFRSELTVSGYTGGEAVQSGLPVLVRISPDKIPGFSYSSCLEGGADVFFATDKEGQSRLACDIDTWNTSGESLAWVKLPEVTGTDTKFYMFWGIGEEAKRPSSTEVWSEYIGVWHMNECDPVMGVRDETGHGFNATNSTTNVSTPTESPFSTGLNLSHGLYAPNYEAVSTSSTNTVPDVFSVSFWFKKPDGVGAGEYHDILRKYATVNSKYRIGYCIQVVNGSTVNFTDYVANAKNGGASGKSPANTSGPDFSQNWLHHVFVTTGTNHTSFVNGVQKVKNACDSKTDAAGKYNSSLRFGLASTSISMDEVRITRVPRSASWVKAEYETMTNPDFVVAASAESLQAAVLISGTPLEYAEDAVQYGTDVDVSIGVAKTYSAPTIHEIAPSYRAVCEGWTLAHYDTDLGFVTTRTSKEPITGENATTCILSPTGYDSLTWLWREEYLIDVLPQTDGTGLIHGAGWTTKNEEVTITAEPLEGYYFYSWVGDTEGNDIFSPSITLTADSSKKLRAIFRPTTDFVFECNESGTVNFFDESNWANGNVPNSDGSSAVILRRPPAGVDVVLTADAPLNIALLDVCYGTGEGSITLDFACGLEMNRVVGDVILRDGAVLSHARHSDTANSKTYALNLEVGGNMTIEDGASVDATAKGYYFKKGPMPCDGSNYQGAGHGGTSQGGYNTDTYRVSANKCYGSIRRPDQPGGGGGTTNGTKNYGGGVIHLIVKNGTLTVNGSIGANGGNTSHSSPAGGSVWIECGTLAGTGSIDAYSGRASTYSHGSGGRIAIRQYIANDISSYTGLIRAGRNPVMNESYNTCHSVGSIYIENANDAEDRGELVVAGYGYLSALSSMACRLDSTIEDIDIPFGKVSVKNNARLEIPTGVTLKVEKGISVTGNGDFHTVANGGAIEMMPGEDGSFVVEGLVKAYEIYCTNSPGATISFAQGAELRNLENGTIKLLGTEEKSLSLVPATQDGQWTMNVVAPDESKTFLQYLAVSNSVVDVGASVTAFNSVDLGGNLNWGFLSNVLPEGTLFTWIGAQNTSWETPGNWDQRIAPRAGDHVRIPSGLSNYPVVSVVDINLASITNEMGASLTLQGVDLFVSNALYTAGTIVDNDQRIVVNGGGDSIVDFVSRVATKVYVEKDSGKVTFPTGFSADKFYTVTPSSLEFVFGAGEEFSFSECNIESRGEDSHILRSTQSGNQWKLLLTENHRIYNVKVSDSNASKGEEITVSSVSTDAGNNTNWVFANNIAEWIANGNGNWSNPENWSTGQVPGENDDVIVAPASGTVTVTADVAVNVKSLTLGGTDAVLNFASSYPISISGDLTLLDDTTLTFTASDTPNTIGGNVLMKSGSKISSLRPVSISGDLTLCDGAVATLSSKNTPNTIGGNVLMKSGSLINHAANAKVFAYRLYMSVKGNMTIEDGASITLTGCGFQSDYGPIDNATNSSSLDRGGAHGSTMSWNGSFMSCNDSIFEPILPGSGGARQGAGAVYLDVVGDLLVDGSIDVRSHRHTGENAHYSPGAAGSICLKVGTLKGTGLVTAATATRMKVNGARKAGAGRIAIYQREGIDWSSSEAITITTQNNDDDNTHGGTIYKELPGDGARGGMIYIEGREYELPNYGVGYTQFPMADDGNPRRAYKNATLVISDLAYIRMATNETFTGETATIKVKDIIFTSAAPRIVFENVKILVMTLAHKDGAGWVGGDYESRLSKFTNRGTRGGIEWYRGGFAIRIK